MSVADVDRGKALPSEVGDEVGDEVESETGPEVSSKAIPRIFIDGRGKDASQDMWGTSIESETAFMRTTSAVDDQDLLPTTAKDGMNTQWFEGDGSDSDDSCFGGQVIVDPDVSLLSSDDDDFLEEDESDSKPRSRRRKKIERVGRFRLGAKLGEGACAVVKEALDETSLRIVAAKIMDLKKLRKISGGKENLEREIQVQRALKKHENIIELIDDIEDTQRGKHYLILEMANGCTVQELMDASPNRCVPESQVKFLMRQVMNGLIYMHGRNVVHRDIKPSNLMLTASSEVKISDFGVAEFLDVYTEKDYVTRTAGSPAFQAPEIANGDAGFSGIKVDVWAAGVTIYYLLTGNVPFVGDNFVQLFKSISKAEFTFPDGISLEAQDLIRKMLDKEWDSRLSPQEVMRHPWFKEENRKKPPIDSQRTTSEEKWIQVPKRKFKIMKLLDQMFESDQETSQSDILGHSPASPAIQQRLGQGTVAGPVRIGTPMPPLDRSPIPDSPLAPADLQLTAAHDGPLPVEVQSTSITVNEQHTNVVEPDTATSISQATTGSSGDHSRPLIGDLRGRDKPWHEPVEQPIPVKASAEGNPRCVLM